MIKRLSSLPARILLLVSLPMLLFLLGLAIGGAALHTGAMREMVALRDERSVRAAAAGLSQNLSAHPDPQQALTTAEEWLLWDANLLDGARLYLVDAKGRVIADPDRARLGDYVGDSPGVPDVVNGQTGSTVGNRPGTGEQIVVAYAPVEGTEWALILEEPWDRVANPRVLYTQLAPLVLLPAFLLTAGIIYVGIGQIVRPLQRLDERATRLGWGDFEAQQRRVGGIEEIRALEASMSRMASQLRASQAGMRNYAAALLQGQEEERARLARELHDETVQTLIALEHRIHMVRRALGRDPATVEGRLEELSRMATEAVQEVRRVVRAMRPLYLEDLGWLSALGALVGELDKREDLRATFSILGPERRLDPMQELALYRIAQEALTNVERHSRADRVDIQVIVEREIRLVIEDNGVGFRLPERPEELASAGHFGLVGMRERAQIIGARLKLDSAPGQGTRVEVLVSEGEQL